MLPHSWKPTVGSSNSIVVEQANASFLFILVLIQMYVPTHSYTIAHTHTYSYMSLYTHTHESKHARIHKLIFLTWTAHTHTRTHTHTHTHTHHAQVLISHILGVDMRALLSSLWPLLPKLEWVFARSAGLDHLICPEMVRDKDKIVVTNTKGVFSHSVSPSTWLDLHIHTYMPTWIHTYSHTCMHTYMHKCIHTLNA